MIVPDINLLIYAYNDGASQHTSARDWWEGLMCGEENVGIPWVVSIGFIRLMSNDRVVTTPLPATHAAGRASDWFRHQHVQPLNPGDQHLEYFRQNLAIPGSGTNLVMDAHISALAMEADAELHTYDSDFARFRGLRWHNPIA